MGRFAEVRARRYIIVLVTCVMALAACASSAYAISVTDAKLAGLESVDYTIDMDGSRIVYSDTRAGNTDVYLYEVGVGERRITTDAANQSDPSIDGTKIVYSDRRNANWAVYLYDLGTSTETRLTGSTNDCYGPAVDGNTVVYIEKTGASTWVIRRLALGGATDMIGMYDASSARLPRNLQIDGSQVAWEALDTTYEGDDEEPHAHTVLFSGGGLKLFMSAYHPLLASGKLAYTSRSNDASYLYTISSKSTKKLASNSVGVALSKTNFVGWDRRSGQVFLKNLASGGRAMLVGSQTEDWAFGGGGATAGTYFAYKNSAGTTNELRGAVFSGTVTGVSTSGATYRGRATVKGMVSTVGGSGVKGKVRLYRSTNGTNWMRVATHVSTKGGKFSFKTNIVKKPTYYRVRFLGTSSKPASTSETLLVKPRLILSRPSLPSTVKLSKRVSLTGRVTPAISGVDTADLDFEFKPKGGSWREIDMDDDSMSWKKHSGYWSYKDQFVQFYTKGSWRVRLERDESDSWAESVSKWRYVTVK